MEKIEQGLDLTKLKAAIVAHNKDNLSFLNILLCEEETTDEKSGYGWYLYLEYYHPNKRFPSACIELEPEEVQFLQNTLKKALYKLIILEKIKINGSYSLYYDGIRNLRLELKSQDNNAWLELIFFNASRRKFITRYCADDIRAILQALQSVKNTGDTMVKQLETIEALTENLAKQSAISQPPVATQPLATSPLSITSQSLTATQPIDGQNLVRHLENMVRVKKTKKIS